MEAASENTQKRKRRRPLRFSEEELALVRFCSPDTKTHRHMQNVAYRQRALHYLSQDQQFAWLCDEKAMMEGEAQAWRPGILAELGRIPDTEEMKRAAAQLCEMKPKTKAAVAMIRRYRIGKSPAG